MIKTPAIDSPTAISFAGPSVSLKNQAAPTATAAGLVFITVLGKAGGKQDARSVWINRMRERRHPNVVAVALANKNARIVWSILSKNEDYRGPETPQAA